MIISASRRTDIPAFYPDWFFNRIEEGFVLVKNPMNHHQISRISLSPSVVDCIVFWTKNPTPILPKLEKIGKYSYYFHYTLNSYGRQLEPNLPPETERIDSFVKLSKKLGANRVVWRYDPIIVTDTYTIDFHVKAFSRLAEILSPFTRRCVISFIDLYQKSKRNLLGLKLNELNDGQISEIASSFAVIAKSCGLEIVSCAEETDVSAFGISHGKCIDESLAGEIFKGTLDIAKDKTQRPACGCVGSIDIGSYDTCPHGCLYCYANSTAEIARHHQSVHDPKSPLLFGKVEANDKISVRKVASCKVLQQSLL